MLFAEYEREKSKLNTVISGISHDFRTSLTASPGYMQMIEKSGELSERGVTLSQSGNRIRLSVFNDTGDSSAIDISRIFKRMHTLVKTVGSALNY